MVSIDDTSHNYDGNLERYATALKSALHGMKNLEFAMNMTTLRQVQKDTRPENTGKYLQLIILHRRM